MIHLKFVPTGKKIVFVESLRGARQFKSQATKPFAPMFDFLLLQLTCGDFFLGSRQLKNLQSC